MMSNPIACRLPPPARRAVSLGITVRGLIAVFALLAGREPLATGFDEALVLATVGEHEVRLADVLRGAPELAARLERGAVGLEEIDDRVNALVRERLFAARAQQVGLTESASVRAELDRALADAYLRERLERAALSATEAELRDHYETHAQDYSSPARMRLAHILLATESEARTVEAELDAGGDFAALAMARSQDLATAVVGGDLGWLTEGELSPRLAWAVARLESGEVSRIMRTEFGYHLVKLHDAVARVLSFDEARAALERDVLAAKRVAFVAGTERELRERLDVRVSEAGMAALATHLAGQGAGAASVEVAPGSRELPGPVPELRLIASRLDIGAVDESRAARPVLIANAGHETLWLDPLESDCTCVEARLRTGGVDPGDVEQFEVIVYRDLLPPGETLATLRIRSNDPRGPALLRVRVQGPEAEGVASAPLFAEPVRLGEGRQWMTRALPVDLDGDGRTDLVATHRKPLRENSLHVWMQGEDGELHPRPQTWVSPGYSALASADLDGDGGLDVVAGSHFSQIVTYMNDGQGGFRDETLVATDDGIVDVVLADFDGDGDLELAGLGWEDGHLDIYEATEAGGWRQVKRLMGDAPGRALAVGDANADGHPDVFALASNDQSALLLADGAGGFAVAPLGFFSGVGAFSSIALADVNRDGHLDVALNGGTGRPGAPNGPDVYLGDGKGEWRPSSEGLKTLYAGAEGVSLLDADGDGNLDLVAAGRILLGTTSEDYGLFLYLGDGRGGWRLEPGSGLPAVGLSRPGGIAVADLNSDDKPDLVVSHGYASDRKGGSITVWYHR